MKKKELEKKILELEKSIQDLWDNMAKLVTLANIQSDVLTHSQALKDSSKDKPEKDITYIR